MILTLFFGAYAFMDGIFALIAAYRRREGRTAVWPLVLVGVLGIAAGIATFLWPEMTALALLMFIAVWALFIGIFQIDGWRHSVILHGHRGCDCFNTARAAQ